MKSKIFKILTCFVLCISTFLFSACNVSLGGGSGNSDGDFDWDDDLFWNDNFDPDSLITDEDLLNINNFYSGVIILYDPGSEYTFRDNLTLNICSFEQALDRQITTFVDEIIYALSIIYGGDDEYGENTKLNVKEEDGYIFEPSNYNIGIIEDVEGENVIDSFGWDGLDPDIITYSLSNEDVWFGDNCTNLEGGNCSETMPFSSCLDYMTLFLSQFVENTNPNLIIETDPHDEKKYLDENGNFGFDLLRHYGEWDSGKFVFFKEPTYNTSKNTYEWQKNISMIQTDLKEWVAQLLMDYENCDKNYNECLSQIDHLGFTTFELERIKEMLKKNIVGLDLIDFDNNIKENYSINSIDDFTTKINVLDYTNLSEDDCGFLNFKAYDFVIDALVDFVSGRKSFIEDDEQEIYDYNVYVKIPRISVMFLTNNDLGVLSVKSMLEYSLSEEEIEELDDLGSISDEDWEQMMNNMEDEIKESMELTDDEYMQMLYEISMDDVEPMLENIFNLKGFLFIPDINHEVLLDKEDSVSAGAYDFVFRNKADYEVEIKLNIEVVDDDGYNDNGEPIFRGSCAYDSVELITKDEKETYVYKLNETFKMQPNNGTEGGEVSAMYELMREDGYEFSVEDFYEVMEEYDIRLKSYEGSKPQNSIYKKTRTEQFLNLWNTLFTVKPNENGYGTQLVPYFEKNFVFFTLENISQTNADKPLELQIVSLFITMW